MWFVIILLTALSGLDNHIDTVSQMIPKPVDRFGVCVSYQQNVRKECWETEKEIAHSTSVFSCCFCLTNSSCFTSSLLLFVFFFQFMIDFHSTVGTAWHSWTGGVTGFNIGRWPTLYKNWSDSKRNRAYWMTFTHQRYICNILYSSYIDSILYYRPYI